jgi:hypothetical protein
MRSAFLASGIHRSSSRLLASLVLVAALAASASASTFHMVDAQTNTGDMIIAVDQAQSSYSGGQWHFALTATNTGTQTYNDVNLVGQFLWDTATSPQTALTYSNSNSWKSGADLFSFASYAIGAGPNMSPVPFLWTDANTPLTWGSVAGSPSQQPATISSSDTLPAIPLGNFGPGASETFTLNCAVPNYFVPDVVGLFVAVPEPSTFVLLLAGGAGLLVFIRRRRCVNR